MKEKQADKREEGRTENRNGHHLLLAGHQVVSTLLHRAQARGSDRHRDSFVVASHNENSLKLAAKQIAQLQLPLQWNQNRSG